MKVLLVNGSSNTAGCTFTALNEIQNVLRQADIETELFQIGKGPVSGCLGCGYCSENGQCRFDDVVNEFHAKSAEVDGFIFGSPVHYASIAGAMSSFLDRVFTSAPAKLSLKPAAGVVSCRRGGGTTAFEEINRYFTINNMPIVASQYWNVVHGTVPEDVEKDIEGLQILRTLGNNMAWLIKSIEAGRKAGISKPEKEKRIWTNFI